MLKACLLLLLQPAPAQEMTVMTFSVRYDNPDDGLSAWPLRKERVAGVMRQADIIGVQEALERQVSDLEALLPGFA